MSEGQAFIWGEGVKVETPHIDSLADDGLICTNYFAVSPVCTPSRASWVSGLYPQATGSPSNNLPLNDSIVTFAEVLKKLDTQHRIWGSGTWMVMLNQDGLQYANLDFRTTASCSTGGIGKSLR